MVMSETEIKELTEKYNDFRDSLWSQIKKFEEENKIRIIIRDYDFISVINLRRGE